MGKSMKIMATNKNAYHDYEILETLEAGEFAQLGQVKLRRQVHQLPASPAAGVVVG